MDLTPRSEKIKEDYINIFDLLKYSNFDENEFKNFEKFYKIVEYKNKTNNLIITHFCIDFNENIKSEYSNNKDRYELILYFLSHMAIENIKTNKKYTIMIDFIYEEKNNIDYHTIVVFLDSNNKIQLIDPNNHTFTNDKFLPILINNNNKYNFINHDIDIFIKGKIYEPFNVNDCIDKYNLKNDYDKDFFIIRSCTNISLIICYEINEILKDTDNNITIADKLKLLSNTNRLNKNISKSIDGTLLKPLHSSDHIERKDTNKKLEICKDTINKTLDKDISIRNKNLSELENINDKFNKLQKNIEEQQNMINTAFKCNINLLQK